MSGNEWSPQEGEEVTWVHTKRKPLSTDTPTAAQQTFLTLFVHEIMTSFLGRFL
jgi:hypothetical protein